MKTSDTMICDGAESRHVDSVQELEALVEWTSIEDKMPAMHSKVLLFFKNCTRGSKVVECGYLNETNSFCTNVDDKLIEGISGFRVTHWMPLPKDPKEIEEDKDGGAVEK